MANNLFDLSTNPPNQEPQNSSNPNSSPSSEHELDDTSEILSDINEINSTGNETTIQEHSTNSSSIPIPHPEMEGVNDSSTLLTTEELNHIAGNYNPEEDALISKEFQLKQDQEAPTERSPSQKGSVRLFAVTGGIGVALLAIATVWTGFLAPKSPVEKAKKEKLEPTPAATTTPDQTAELKSQLAFAEQQRRLEESNQSKPEVSTSKTKRRTNSREPRTPRTRTVAERPARRPAPIPQRIASPARATVPIRTPRATQTKPEKPVDPFKTWEQLAQLGQEQGNGIDNSPNATNTATAIPSAEATAAAANPTIQPVSTLNQSPSTTSPGYAQTTIQTATIGDPPLPSNDLTQGEYGILNHQDATQATDNSVSPSNESASVNTAIAVDKTGFLIDETTAMDESTPADKTDSVDSTAVAMNSEISSPDSSDTDHSTAEPTDSTGLANSTDLDSLETAPPAFDAPTSVTPKVSEPALYPEVKVSNAKSLSPSSSATYQPKEVALGSSASGTVSVPLVWGQNGKTPISERGAIELNEPLLAKDGNIALPTGTKLITQTALVGNIPQTSVIAIIRNRGGEIQQYPLPPNILVIRSSNGEPLLGKNINDIDPALLKGDDFLVGILGGLGQLGEVLNRDRTESSSTFSGNGISQTITNRSRDPNVVGAILQGALQPATERMKQRITAREQEQQRRQENLPNIAVVPKGTTVMIIAQNILRVNP